MRQRGSEQRSNNTKGTKGVRTIVLTPLKGGGSEALERLIEIGDQVFGVFHATRETNQPVADADLRSALRRHGRMRHRRRQTDQTLDAAERLGEREDFH